MTDRPAPGTYSVLDAHARDTINALLVSVGHLLNTASVTSPAPPATSYPDLTAELDEALATAEKAIAERDDALTRIKVETTAGRIEAERAAQLESDLAATNALLEQTAKELQTARNTTTPAPARGDSKRVADRKAFEALALRMEGQAPSLKSTDAANSLRLAARALRDEIETVYGVTLTPARGKKAS